MLGQIAWIIAAAFGGKKSRRLKLQQFLPFIKETKRKQTIAEQAAIGQQLRGLFIGKHRDTSNQPNSKNVKASQGSAERR